MSNSGGSAALRGYRLQTLYILSRLMNAESHEHSFRPEGKEDLDIYTSNGQLLETVQVKAFTPNLTLSDFSPQKDYSFFKRSLRNLATNPGSTIRVVSFGPIGPEIEKAWSQEGPERESVRAKFTEYGYSTEEINGLLAIEFSVLDESELKKKVFAFLKNTMTAGDPPHAFGLLMYWVFIASELKEQIRYSTVIDRLISVGRYVGARSAYHDEWYTSILPLTDTLNSDDNDPQLLAQEYFQGVDARYEHILAGLDVVRSDKMAEIEQKFESSNVVIVHGASGQGKSTLAFRYLHENASSDWRFYVDLRLTDDKRQVLRVANALSGHAKAIQRPCIVYIDVSPSDQDWTELVRSLSDLPELRILVTIREEDWRRATGYRARFVSEELELSFDEEEAGNLYVGLKDQISHYLAFDEAWVGFGGQGPLLEFVYFLTQNQTLKSRVEDQIQSLKDHVRMGQLTVNELHLLRLVAVASAYEAKLDLKALVERLGLSEPARTIELFTKEYLIRIDESGSTVTGLHAVRSNIMLESLLDDVLSSWKSTGVECLPLLVETDLEIFLLHAFSRRRTEATALLEELESFHPKSWIGVAGILRALLWLGVYDYTESNRALIDEVSRERGPGWYLILDSDLTEIAPDTISNIWHNMPDLGGKERLIEYVESIRVRQTPKCEAFVHARHWLQDFDSTGISPSLSQDYAGLAEVLFWSSHFQIQPPISSTCEKIDFEKFVEEIPIDTLADLICALYIALGEEFDSIYLEYRSRVELRFKRETNTFSLEDDGATVRANFIPDSAYELSQDEHGNENTESSTLHEETRYRVDLLRKLLPNRQKYSIRGYGHRLGTLSPEYDETEKSVDVSNFYPQWAQRINVHFRTLGNYPHRPEDWEEHAQHIFELRNDIRIWLDQLQQALNVYFRKSDVTKIVGKQLSTSAFERCEQVTKTRPLLPQSAVDEWGFTGEDITSSARTYSDILSQSGLYEKSPMTRKDSNVFSESSLYEQFPALVRHKAYTDKLHGYLRHLSNFMSQGKHVILLNFALGRAERHQEKELLRIANENSIKTDQESLSTWNLHDALVALTQLQIEFRNRFLRFIPAADLDKLEKEENRLIRELWLVWYQFAFHPRRKKQSAAKEFVRERDETLKRVRRGVRQKLRSNRHEGFSAYEARTELQHRGESIPCVLIDIDNPSMYWQAVQDTIVALQNALHTDSNKSLRSYAIQFWLKHFAVVPLIRGRALSRSAFVFPTLALQSGIALEKLHLYISQEFTDEDWEKLNVSLWDLERFQPAIGFAEDIVFLSLLASQIGDLSRFPEDCGGFDSGITDNYLQTKSENITEYLQRVYDVGGGLLSQLSCPHIDFEKRPALGEAYNILIHICQEVRPAENHDSSTPMTVDEIKEWSVRLEQLWDYAEHFKLLWITDVIDRHATED